MAPIFGLRGRGIAVAALAIFAVAAGVAWAAIPGPGGVIQGCYKKANGQLRVVESAAACDPSEVAISWNEQGQQGEPGESGTPGEDGTDGVSPTVAQEAPGANCAAGGAKITDAAGTTAYVCSGKDGDDGEDGQNGLDGDPFSGTFTSPNGEYSIAVTDAGISLARGGGPFITLAGNDITVKSSGTATVEAGTNLTLKAAANASLKAGGTGTVESGATLALKGALVQINAGSCLAAARVGDIALGIAPGGDGAAAVLSTITTGSPTVCIG